MEYTNGVVKQFVIIVEVSYSNKSTNKKGAAKKVRLLFTNLVTAYMASSTKAPMNWLI